MEIVKLQRWALEFEGADWVHFLIFFSWGFSSECWQVTGRSWTPAAVYLQSLNEAQCQRLSAYRCLQVLQCYTGHETWQKGGSIEDCRSLLDATWANAVGNHLIAGRIWRVCYSTAVYPSLENLLEMLNYLFTEIQLIRSMCRSVVWRSECLSGFYL